MSSFNLPTITTLFAATLISLLSACGGGGGSAGTNESGFTANNNTNTKPQTSSADNIASSSSEESSSSSAVSSIVAISSIASSQASLSSSSSSSPSSKSSARSSAASNSSAPRLTIDTTAPSTTPEVTLIFTEYDIVAFSWAAATDNVGVTAYKIYRNQIQIDQINAIDLTYADFNVAPNSTYTYGVSAGDAAGNWSTVKTIIAKTQQQPVPPSSASSSSLSSPSSASSKSSSSFSSSSLSSPSNSSSKSSNASKSSAASSSSASINGDVTLYWAPPTQREDGTAITGAELGGFLIRYKLKTASDYTLIDINDNSAKSSIIPSLTGDYEFQIAAYDSNNLYSTFVALSPK
jgi:hypothetical protein